MNIANFRQRNQELEALNLEQQQQMALLNSEVERLRTDNAALYEKVRFLQSYSGQVRYEFIIWYLPLIIF